MPKPYDATTKWLIDLHPQDWLRLLGFPPANEVEPVEVEVEFLDTDLATVTAATDRVLKVRQPKEFLLHVELESGHHGSEKPQGLLKYSVLLTAKYHLPVETAIVLLRRQADSPALTGELSYRRADDTVYLHFQYNTVRIWEIPVEALLSGGIGTVPLAPLALVPRANLPEVVLRMQERFDTEGVEQAAELWTATKVLMGLRYSRKLTDSLLKGVREMRESVTYQAILEEGEAKGVARGRVEGRVEEAQRMLLLMGEGRLGLPSSNTVAKVASIDLLPKLEQLGKRLFAVESWDELLAG